MSAKLPQVNQWDIFKEKYSDLVMQVDTVAKEIVTTTKLKKMNGGNVLVGDGKRAATLAKDFLQTIHQKIQEGFKQNQKLSISVSIKMSDEEQSTIFLIFNRMGFNMEFETATSNIKITLTEHFCNLNQKV